MSEELIVKSFSRFREEDKTYTQAELDQVVAQAKREIANKCRHLYMYNTTDAGDTLLDLTVKIKALGEA